MVEQKLKKIGEILDNIANHNIDKLDHFHSELDKKHSLLDQKHAKLVEKHKHLNARQAMMQQRHSNLKLKEKEYTCAINLKKGMDRKAKKLALFHKELKEKRANLDALLHQERLKIEGEYIKKEHELQKLHKQLAEKDKKLNQDIIALEVQKVQLLQSLSSKTEEKLVPGSAVDLWPMKMALSMQQAKTKEQTQVLKDLPNVDFIKELKAPNVKRL